MRSERRWSAALTWYAHDAGKCSAEPTSRNSASAALRQQILQLAFVQGMRVADEARAWA